MAKITKQQVPTLLTGLRIFLIIPIVYVFSAPSIPKEWLFVLFVIGAATDFLDGYLARKWNAQSDLGGMLDQISDKLFIVTILFMLTLYKITGILTVLVIILREIYVSGLREHAGLRNITLPVSKVGKYKTATQMIGLGIVLAGVTLGLPVFPLGGIEVSAPLIGNWILIIGALLGVISAVQYTLALKRK